VVGFVLKETLRSLHLIPEAAESWKSCTMANVIRFELLGNHHGHMRQSLMSLEPNCLGVCDDHDGLIWVTENVSHPVCKHIKRAGINL
jgi:hypothetical protein